MASSLPRWLRKDGAQPASFITKKYVYIPIIAIVTLVVILQPLKPANWHASDMLSMPSSLGSHSDRHIIHDLVAQADDHFEQLRQSETFSLSNAAKQYRERRGRHPPPGFDAWYALARQSSTVVVEAFYDQVYEDLEPFWGIEPHDLRDFARRWPTTLTIRNGTPERRFSPLLLAEWFGVWENMTRAMPMVPDVDLALLAGDQPVVMASFDKVSKAMEGAVELHAEHRTLPVNQIKQDFPIYPPLAGEPATEWPADGLVPYPEDSERFWDYVAATCKTSDPVSVSPELVPNASLPLVFSDQYTAGTTRGFVSNITQARSVCHNPNLRTLHGFVIRPGMSKFYTELHPIFSFGKIAGIQNDIVIPAPANYREGEYSGLNSMQPWEKKQDTLVWRGTATGGDWRPDTWFGFQRHRFVSMLNSTVVQQAQSDMANLAAQELPQTYQALLADYKRKNETLDLNTHHINLPQASLFQHPLNSLATWLESKTSVGFTHLFCWPFRTLGAAGDCPYMVPYFKLASFLSAGDVLMHKYLPDIDGQSISARFRGFLQSTSVPIKATIFTEWHDSRLTPWRDYIPLSNEFQELYELLYFFIGDRPTTQPSRRHTKRADWWHTEKNSAVQDDADAIGERIGQQGSEWTRRVMRKEDMVLYFYRVILEYARITSDDRVQLGWVDDLLSNTAAGSTAR